MLRDGLHFAFPSGNGCEPSSPPPLSLPQRGVETAYMSLACSPLDPFSTSLFKYSRVCEGEGRTMLLFWSSAHARATPLILCFAGCFKTRSVALLRHITATLVLFSGEAEEDGKRGRFRTFFNILVFQGSCGLIQQEGKQGRKMM